jgi:SWI/SNF-related matrix-associated actin-dependent regulator of chromatin subfamily A3
MPPRSIPWMAPNGAKQGQAPDSSKRKREVVDLTGETSSTPKMSRTSTHTPSRSRSSAGPSSTAAGGRSFARTPSWTQPSPSSQRSRTAQVPPWTPPQQHSQAERDAWLQEEDNDIFENVASSQAPPVSHEQYQKYGSLDTKCVGVRFYTGFATIGERITIKREPTNPYDSNASQLLKERPCKSFAESKSSNRQHGERADRSHWKVHYHKKNCFVRTAH